MRRPEPYCRIASGRSPLAGSLAMKWRHARRDARQRPQPNEPGAQNASRSPALPAQPVPRLGGPRRGVSASGGSLGPVPSPNREESDYEGNRRRGTRHSAPGPAASPWQPPGQTGETCGTGDQCQWESSSGHARYAHALAEHCRATGCRCPVSRPLCRHVGTGCAAGWCSRRGPWER
jgi:hypothetical protein